jgi:hypothetical protein
MAVHLKVLALSCLVVEPVVHGTLGPGIGGIVVAVGLVGYLLALALTATSQTGLLRGLAVFSLGVGGTFLGGWGWVRFGPAALEAPWMTHPWFGQAALAVEITTLTLMLGKPRVWAGVLVVMWTLGLPWIQREIFLLAPQVAVLWPSLMAVAAMVVLGRIGRRLRVV